MSDHLLPNVSTTIYTLCSKPTDDILQLYILVKTSQSICTLQIIEFHRLHLCVKNIQSFQSPRTPDIITKAKLNMDNLALLRHYNMTATPAASTAAAIPPFLVSAAPVASGCAVTVFVDFSSSSSVFFGAAFAVFVGPAIPVVSVGATAGGAVKKSLAPHVVSEPQSRMPVAISAPQQYGWESGQV